MLDNTLRPAIAEGASAELARRNLLDFGKLVYPEFAAPKHIRYIASLLEDLEAGKIRRLCIATPVRHGKSVICSQLFPAWYLGRRPKENVILASHSESLAVLHSRIAKSIVDDSSQYPFEAKISSDSASVQRWNLTVGGGMYAIGVGGAITGRGANLLILDDALHDGLSESERDSAWTWFSTVAVPRLEPGGRILVVSARMAYDDIMGHLQESEEAAEWKFISLPAICNSEEDLLGRAIGEPLWPERVSLEELESRRVAMGSAAFSCQLQQDPTPSGGTLWDRSWLEHRYDSLPDRRGPQDTRPAWQRNSISLPELDFAPVVIMACDSAWKTGLSNDFSVIVTIMSDGKNFYVMNVWRKRVEYPELLAAVVSQYQAYLPDSLYVEEAASGYALVQDLKRSSGLPIVAVKPDSSKTARAETISPLLEAGRVLFPKSAPWLEETLQELVRFPAARHDDIVDALVLGITKAQSSIARQQTALSMSKLSSWIER